MRYPEECCFPKPIEFCIPEKIRCVRCVPKLVWVCKEEEFFLKECHREHMECPKCHMEHEECQKCHKERMKRCEREGWRVGEEDGDGFADECDWRVGGCR